MATAPRKGFNPARKVGSAPDNKALTEYSIASGYGTALGAGDAVKLETDGTVVVATNGDEALGVFHGCLYLDDTKRIQYQKYWPAGQTSTEIAPTALILDDPNATFHCLADGPVVNVLVGDIYAMNLSAPNSNIGHSTMTVATTATRTGTVDVTAVAQITDIAGINNNDTFTVKSTVTNIVTTVTLLNGQTPAQLLVAISGNGVTASYEAGTGYLVLQATDGGDLVLADGVGTPLADGPTLIGAAGTVTSVVAANAGMVKVLKVADIDTQVLEVTLVNHS
jgi:hypothetical protein